MAATTEKTTERAPRLGWGRTERVETVIVGGGQAGLATAYHLTRRGRPAVVLDENERVGDGWRRRWDSLLLYSPARYDSLPGLKFPAPPLSFPKGRDMAEYLESYVEHFELPVRSGARADGLWRNGDGWVVSAGAHRFEADNVVIATGPFQRPVVPGFAEELDPSIRQLHSNDYRRPDQLQEGPALVVGAAHSGADIAYEVAPEHRTLLSGRDTGHLPFRVDSRRVRVLWPVLKFAATRLITVKTPLGRKAKPQIRAHGGPLLRVRSEDLEAAGVERVPRTVGARNGLPLLEDGRLAEVTNVVWCTGFRADYGWLHVPLPLDEDGFPAQRDGAVEGLPGLFFAGLMFQHGFASMLIVGAGPDGKRVAKGIERRARELSRERAA